MVFLDIYIYILPYIFTLATWNSFFVSDYFLYVSVSGTTNDTARLPHLVLRTRRVALDNE